MAKKDEQPKNVKSLEPEDVNPKGKGPVIQTIPEKFYGAALKARIPSGTEEKPSGQSEVAPKAPTPVPNSGGGGSKTIIVILVAIILLGGTAAGFVYFNQHLIFPQEEAAPVVAEAPKPPAPPPPPAAPSNLTATSTSYTVIQLRWEDESDNESGFRIERRGVTTSYQSITSLSPNSSAFQDRAVEPETTYLYRVIAVNEGGESPASNEYTVETLPAPPPPEEPIELPPAGLDTDSDGLTDLEEPLYGTSIRDPDADDDSFNDGNEVFHLYNPAGGSSLRLYESGLVKPMESSVGWKLFVPVTWTFKVAEDGLSGTVTTGHGETFEVRLLPNPEQIEVLEWYLAEYPGTLSTQTVSITTKAGLAGLEGVDLLTTYFAWGGSVLAFEYHLNDQPFVNYRTTYEMMKNSLILTPNPALPDAFLLTVPESDEDMESTIEIEMNTSTPTSTEEVVEEESTTSTATDISTSSTTEDLVPSS
jgi:hypothetical protein